MIINKSEIFRGQNPLYVSLKMTGFGLLLMAVLWSFINTLFIIFENKKMWRKYTLWIFVSLLPFLLFSGIIGISFIKAISD